MDIVTEKKCTKCGEVKSFSEYYKKSRGRNGIQSQCKSCVSAEDKIYKEKYNISHASYIKEYDRKYREDNREKRNFYSCIYNAQRRGAVGKFSLVQWKVLCLFYGNKCVCCLRKGKLTVDHVVPIILGGENNISNVQPLCQRCNGRKGNKTIDYRFDKGEFARVLHLFSK